jgi:predicted RNase H-related nuclease YkuK (DUF458 family)
MSHNYDLARMIISSSSADSSVYIGCDSKVFKSNGRWFARYTTVIVVHMDSRHGARVFHYSEVQPDFKNIRVRMVTEAQHAINVFDAIADVIGDRHCEIHLDINASPKHKSNEAAQEAMGYVLGVTGIKPKIKPEAFAASYAADHCVRGKHNW